MQRLLVYLLLLFLAATQTDCWMIGAGSIKTLFRKDLPNAQQNTEGFGLTKHLAKIAIATSILTSAPSNSRAAADVPVYFGVGCFWHVQHEFVSTEVSTLGRSVQDITAKAGYAGGTRKSAPEFNPAQPGKPYLDLVCYHNLLGKADYDSLGHTEVVGMSVPADKIETFAEEYFSLYGSDSERPDKVHN